MKILKQKKFLLIVVFTLAVFFSLHQVSRAAGLVPCGGPSDASPCKFTDLFVLIARVTNWLIAMAGLYAFFQIINAGFWLTITMGNEESITKWRGALNQAIVGFVLVLMAFMLINTVVNVILGQGLIDGIGGQKANQACKLDLTNPLTYLTINPSCSNTAH